MRLIKINHVFARNVCTIYFQCQRPINFILNTFVWIWISQVQSQSKCVLLISRDSWITLFHNWKKKLFSHLIAGRSSFYASSVHRCVRFKAYTSSQVLARRELGLPTSQVRLCKETYLVIVSLGDNQTLDLESSVWQWLVIDSGQL